MKVNAYSLIRDDIVISIRDFMKKGLIVNPNINERNWTPIRISSSQRNLGIQEGKYNEYFNMLRDSRDYLCELIDGSFFQVNFEFEKKSKSKIYVRKAMLAYYPRPCEYESIFDENSMKNYLRIDYNSDPVDHTHISHPSGHLHIGQYGDTRIGISRVPLFSDFFYFTLYINWHDKWIEEHSNETGDLIESFQDIIRKRNELTERLALDKEEREYLSLTI